MWGQNWGQMIWGSAVSVPALDFWGTMLLGATVGVLGARYLRGPRPRTLGALALALALFIPISARAVLTTFANGTVADAEKVNANFAALVPISGTARMTLVGEVPNEHTILETPSFVAPRAMTCSVSLGSELRINGLMFTPPAFGYAYLLARKNENGTLEGPMASEFSFYSATSVAHVWNAAETRLFSVGAGSTVKFGCDISTNSDFSATASVSCVVVYLCV